MVLITNNIHGNYEEEKYVREKMELPAKPSLVANNWVIHALHCQSCSSIFTSPNQKQNCRCCGGLFCNTCTQRRIVLQGQGDSPVPICESCKRLQEATRFTLRYGFRNYAGKGCAEESTQLDDTVSKSAFVDRKTLERRILVLKKEAITQKRSGNMVEGVLLLRKAKNLEKDCKNLDTVKMVLPESVREKYISSNANFTLLQECLDHKRKALQLLREGRTKEAHTELELAKTLEPQLEEVSSRTVNEADEFGIENLLHPELLAALQSIGLGNAHSASSIEN